MRCFREALKGMDRRIQVKMDEINGREIGDGVRSLKNIFKGRFDINKSKIVQYLK